MLGIGLSVFRRARIAPLYERDAFRYRKLVYENTGIWIAEAEMVEIRRFALGLYARVGRTDFWMLRAGQNVGTGSVVYSFHGKVGTLVNGPTWGVDGITFGAINRYFTTSGYPASSALPIAHCYIGRVDTHDVNGILCDISTLGNNYDVFNLSQTNSTQIGTGLRLNDSGSWGPWANVHTYTVSQFLFAAESYDPAISTQIFRIDGQTTSRTVASTVTVGPRLRLNIRSDVLDQGSRTTAAFAMRSSAALTDADFAYIRQLYKSTIGEGLGLP